MSEWMDQQMDRQMSRIVVQQGFWALKITIIRIRNRRVWGIVQVLVPPS